MNTCSFEQYIHDKSRPRSLSTKILSITRKMKHPILIICCIGMLICVVSSINDSVFASLTFALGSLIVFPGWIVMWYLIDKLEKKAKLEYNNLSKD